MSGPLAIEPEAVGSDRLPLLEYRRDLCANDPCDQRAIVQREC